ncbi:MAG: hypothetical protein CMO55_15070 [Verrucomicrobiales bacterium]|nr:hypothetical protein [Verrucomicrobiales bacterium]
MAKRYDQRTKEKVVSFVKGYNAEHGRGGQSAAVKKFSINPITVRSWLDNIDSSAAPSSKKKNSGKTGTKRKLNDDSVIGVLERMQKIQAEIKRLQTEYERLKASI